MSKANDLSHRALMLLINSKLDYLVAESSVIASLVRNPNGDLERLNKFRTDARDKLNRQIKEIVNRDKTKGGLNGE